MKIIFTDKIVDYCIENNINKKIISMIVNYCDSEHSYGIKHISVPFEKLGLKETDNPVFDKEFIEHVINCAYDVETEVKE